jgi:hypothetical protein
VWNEERKEKERNEKKKYRRRRERIGEEREFLYMRLGEDISYRV